MLFDRYIDEFNKSYIQCINRIDPMTTFPFNESQLIGTYFDEIHVFKKNYIEVLDIIPLNPSILRSMLVMDLYGESPDEKKKIFRYYLEILMNYYTNDIFSLKQNIPKKYDIKDYFDYSYFSEYNQDVITILNICFEFSYNSRFDIFADNVYEVIGPFYYRNKICVLYRFNYILEYPIEILYFGENTLGCIDMFGHSDINFKIPTHILLYNSDIIDDYKGFISMLMDKALCITQIPDMNGFINSYRERYQYMEIPSFQYNPKNIVDKITDRAKLIKKIIL